MEHLQATWERSWSGLAIHIRLMLFHMHVLLVSSYNDMRSCSKHFLSFQMTPSKVYLVLADVTMSCTLGVSLRMKTLLKTMIDGGAVMWQVLQIHVNTFNLRIFETWRGSCSVSWIPCRIEETLCRMPATTVVFPFTAMMLSRKAFTGLRWIKAQ